MFLIGLAMILVSIAISGPKIVICVLLTVGGILLMINEIKCHINIKKNEDEQNSTKSN
jgi:hypothetical protein